MGTDSDGTAILSRRIARLRDHYVLKDAVESDNCLSKQSINELARDGQFPLFEHDHVKGCVRCASLYVTFRALACIERLADKFGVRIELCEELDIGGESSIQILGRISLDGLQFHQCPSDVDWEPHPMSMRVNMVLDPIISMFAVSVLEVPEEIETIHLKTPDGSVELTPGEPSGTYELFVPVAESGTTQQSLPPVKRLLERLSVGQMELLYTIHSRSKQRSIVAQADDVEQLLRLTDAIEQEFDYVLPTGLHTDTHIHTAKLCHSESAIEHMARAIDEAFPEQFDVIVSNGWPLATIARRVAAIRNDRSVLADVREIMFEGYVDPMPLEDVPSGSRVLVLVDVSVTGMLMRRLVRAVERFGAEIVAKGAIVSADHQLANDDPDLRSLCRIKMSLSRTGNTRTLQWREQRHFNPLSNCMTEKRKQGRGPTEFYREDPEVREFWDMLQSVFEGTSDVSRFYRRHRVIEDTHYSEFFDTRELILHESFGKLLIEKMRDKLAEARVVPDVILCADRVRATIFADKLRDVFDISTGLAPIVLASKERRGWAIDSKRQDLIRGRRVLVVDAAVGHGKTIDQLAILAEALGARSVGAAVILSRISESCELAFGHRLSDGYHRLFNLPIRPVIIRGASKELCPVCQRQVAIENAAAATRSKALENLAAARTRVPFGRKDEERSPQPSEQQLTLFDDPKKSPLTTCRAAVARGLTLHSLYAAKNNGMAPLALPELMDDGIPARNKHAMVKDLPRGALEWSGRFLEEDLERCLTSDDTTQSVCSASILILASEQRVKWLPHLGRIVDRRSELRNKPQPTFWNTVECSAYMVVRENPRQKEEFENELKNLVEKHAGTEAEAGLRQVLDTVSQLDAV